MNRIYTSTFLHTVVVYVLFAKCFVELFVVVFSRASLLLLFTPGLASPGLSRHCILICRSSLESLLWKGPGIFLSNDGLNSVFVRDTICFLIATFIRGRICSSQRRPERGNSSCTNDLPPWHTSAHVNLLWPAAETGRGKKYYSLACF